LSILGRDDELARLDSSLESLRSASVKLLLEGEAGIGKTTLLLAGIGGAESRSYAVLTTRPSEADRALPWAGVVDLLSGVAESTLGTLPVPQRDALEVALLRRVAHGRPPDQRAVLTAFVNVVAELANESPVVLAIDDLQWLDPPSRRALEFLGRRLPPEGVGLLATTRVSDGTTASGHAVLFEPADHLRLAPLTAAALHRVVRERFGLSLARPALVRLHRLCAGNAFFAFEIMARLREAGPIDAHADWPLPDDVRDVVQLHVSGLPVQARRELLRAAAAAQPTEDLVGAETLAAAEADGLIRRVAGGRIRFAHPLFAEAIYAGASPADRRDMHAWLGSHEGDTVERARHLALATDQADAGVAAELDAAAGHARSRGAPESAAQLLELALQLTPQADDATAQERTIAAASDWFHAGAVGRAGELLTHLLSAPSDRRERARALRLLALVHFREESIPLALERLHEAALAAGDDDDLRTPVELELAFASVNVSFDFEAALPHADRALAGAERLRDRGLLAQALAVKAVADCLNGAGIDDARLRRALELDTADLETPVELQPALIGASLALYQGSLERARTLLEDLCARLRENGCDSDLTFPLCIVAWVESWAGNLDAAQAAADEAVELARLSGSETFVGYSHAYAAFAAAHSGDEATCRAHVDAALSGMERSGYAIHATWSLSALGLLELSRGDTAAAAATYASLLGMFTGPLPPEPVRAFFVPDAIESFVATGDIARAIELTEEFMARAVALDRAWAIGGAHRCRALAAAAIGDLDGAGAEIDRAIELQERGEMPLQLARSLIVRGQLERRGRRKASARVALERAEAICTHTGAERWAERARSELARLDGTPRRDELSPTERRVAELAAAGLTNREIAAAAFMSEKTVEANLSRAYRKLGVRSRTELAVLLVDEGEAERSTR
jgi:DNA-binding CsgD family transcriptional regulator